MKVGDLVKLKRPTTRDYASKAFVVTETHTPSAGSVATWGDEWSLWIKLAAPEGSYLTGWTSASDYEVINESR